MSDRGVGRPGRLIVSPGQGSESSVSSVGSAGELFEVEARITELGGGIAGTGLLTISAKTSAASGVLCVEVLLDSKMFPALNLSLLAAEGSNGYIPVL